MKESVVEKYLKQRVRLLGGDTRKVAWIGRIGCPDRVVLWPECVFIGGSCKGRMDWIELKSPKGYVRDTQRREHARFAVAGVKVWVLNSFAAVDAYIQETGRGRVI